MGYRHIIATFLWTIIALVVLIITSGFLMWIGIGVGFSGCGAGCGYLMIFVILGALAAIFLTYWILRRAMSRKSAILTLVIMLSIPVLIFIIPGFGNFLWPVIEFINDLMNLTPIH